MTPRVGEALPEWVVESVAAEPMAVLAALLRDPNPIHLDPAAVRRIGLGDRVVNQGPANLGYVLEMLIAFVGGGEERVRAVSVRFAAAVFAGDRVVGGGRVVGVQDGRVDCEVWLDAIRPGSPDPVRVLAGTAVVGFG